jgi:hypothetical protein
MHDPRTRIEPPNVLALLLVAVLLTLGYGILNVAEARYGDSVDHPFRFATSTLFLACTCAWCLRSVTIDNRPGHDLSALPLVTLVKLPGHIAAVPNMGPTDDGCLREYRIPEGNRIVYQRSLRQYGSWPVYRPMTDSTRLDASPLNEAQRDALRTYLSNY